MRQSRSSPLSSLGSTPLVIKGITRPFNNRSQEQLIHKSGIDSPRRPRNLHDGSMANIFSADSAPRRTSPPIPPRYDLWPPALRSAEVLRGSLVACGPGVRGVGWPETPTVRAAALAHWLEGGRVATHLTAAWIWGASHSPGRPLQVTVRSGSRRRVHNTDWLRVYEMRHTDADIQHFGDYAVMTPFRTVLDLLYEDAPFTLTARVASRLLIRFVDGGVNAVLSHIDTHKRPRKRVARERLALLMRAGHPPCTR